MIRAVFFDLFGTLVPGFTPALFQGSLRRMGHAVGIAYEEFSRAWCTETYPGRHTGAYATFQEEIRAICAPRGITPTQEQLAEAVRIRYAFARETLVPRPDAVATIRTLKDRGLRIGLISDCSMEVPELWPALSVAPLFDATVFSCLMGTKKPDPRMYTTACEALDVAPAACLYVGDGSSRELHGARGAGMRPVLIRVVSEVHAPSPSWEGHDWDGEEISSLSELPALLERT